MRRNGLRSRPADLSRSGSRIPCAVGRFGRIRSTNPGHRCSIGTSGWPGLGSGLSDGASPKCECFPLDVVYHQSGELVVGHG